MQEWCNTRWVCLNNFEWLSSFSPFSEKPNIYLYIYYIHIYMYMYVYIYISYLHLYLYMSWLWPGFLSSYSPTLEISWPNSWSLGLFLLPLKPLQRYTRNWLAPL
jgi:hypothetical protein